LLNDFSIVHTLQAYIVSIVVLQLIAPRLIQNDIQTHRLAEIEKSTYKLYGK